MTIRALGLYVLAALACLSGTAAAQTPAAAPAPPAPPAPLVRTPAVAGADSGFFVGAIAGGGSVQNVGGLFGGEAGFSLSDRIDVFGEGMWIEDVISRRRLGLAATIGAYLQNSQGKPATATIVAPASYGGGGVRYTFVTSGAIRPYVAVTVGGAHIAFKPAFTLSGSDITSTLPQYGITIGSDLTGETTKPAVSGGAGVRFVRVRWYVDADARVISIRTPDQTTNVLRASASVGIRLPR